MMRYFISVVALFAAVASDTAPHILFIVVDDLGWNDMSFRGGSDLKTPHIDALAKSGTILDGYYVHPLCSPTRSAFLSGRSAYTTGMAGTVIINGHPLCLPGPPTVPHTLPEALRQRGYTTAMQGKWDLGMTTWNCTPTQRGFDHFVGFYNAYNDYFTYRPGVGGYTGPPALDLRNNTRPIPEAAGHYSTRLFGQEAMRVASSHVAAAAARGDAAHPPLFQYLAFQAMHVPLEAPATSVTDTYCAQIANPMRKQYCAMLWEVDETVSRVVSHYRTLGLWNRTVLVLTTDNGGHNGAGSNNWPLRGSKATVWEGGTRGTAFVSGGAWPATAPRAWSGLMHAADWLPTLIEASGGGQPGAARGAPASLSPLDGMSVWESLRTGGPSPRLSILYNINPATPQQAVRRGPWKLVTGLPSVARGSNQRCASEPAHAGDYFCQNGWVPLSGHPEVPSSPSMNETTAGGAYLYNVEADPTERSNVAADHPDLVAELRSMLASYGHIPQPNPAYDVAADPRHYNLTWTPWR
eukprot:TRINITY_DN69277_c0_g1_i1.p1 TRINITY_DN69277_c0_g1~~TRINITY_DN69277_c0_g1_i1.p1  ORF type:complete len:523 (+),score=76.82 TRINITY_DN69277_c0_g1_i1:144-1712(+)